MTKATLASCRWSESRQNNQEPTSAYLLGTRGLRTSKAMASPEHWPDLPGGPLQNRQWPGEESPFPQVDWDPENTERWRWSVMEIDFFLKPVQHWRCWWRKPNGELGAFTCNCMTCSRSFLAAWKMALTLLEETFSPAPSLKWYTAEGVCIMVTLFLRIDWETEQDKSVRLVVLAQRVWKMISKEKFKRKITIQFNLLRTVRQGLLF